MIDGYRDDKSVSLQSGKYRAIRRNRVTGHRCKIWGRPVLLLVLCTRPHSVFRRDIDFTRKHDTRRAGLMPCDNDQQRLGRDCTA